MPVLKSFAFASNRGGVGKTTTVVQLAAMYAKMHPLENVLLVDFSVHGDATSMLLGGTQSPPTNTLGVHTLGQYRAMLVPPERTAAGLVDAVLKRVAAPELATMLTRMTLRLKGLREAARTVLGANPPALDLNDHCINVAETTLQPAPPNLFITPSYVNSEEQISSLENALLDPDAQCGCNSDAWLLAIEPLRAAMSATVGQWVLFFDTDAELVERAPSRLALAAADKAVMMLSSDWRAYIRLMADSRNGLFRFLKTLADNRKPHSKICMLLMNNVEPHKQEPALDKESEFSTPEGKRVVKLMPVSFSPSKALHLEMSTIADHMFGNHVTLTDFIPLWARGIISTHHTFYSVYLDAIPKNTASVDLITNGTGIPIASLDAETVYVVDSGMETVGKVKQDKLDAKTLMFHQRVLEHVVEKLDAAY